MSPYFQNGRKDLSQKRLGLSETIKLDTGRRNLCKASFFCLSGGIFPFLSTSTFASHKNYKKVISVGSSITEIIFRLGASQKLVGVDTTSNYPEQSQQVPKVGYLRTLSTEGILSLKPDLLLLSEEAGPPQVLAQLKTIGLAQYSFPVVRSIEGVSLMINQVGKILQVEALAKELKNSLQKDWDACQVEKLAFIKHQFQKLGRPLKVVFIMSHIPGKVFVAGKNTAADAMIHLSGAKNPLKFEGYSPLSAESLLLVNPDIILVSTQGLNTLGGQENLWKLAGMSLTNAAKKRALLSLEANYLLGFGPRLPSAIRDLQLGFLNKLSEI